MNHSSETNEEEDSPVSLDHIFKPDKKFKIDEMPLVPIKRHPFLGSTGFPLRPIWNSKKTISEYPTSNLKSESEKSEPRPCPFEIREQGKLIPIILKIKQNSACKSLERFVRKYYLSKKQSFVTIIRKKIEELLNFNDEYLVPLSQYHICNIYDKSTLSFRFRKPNNYSNFTFFREDKSDDYEIVFEPQEWKTKLIHGIEKMMLAQSFSESYLRSSAASNFSIGLKFDYDPMIGKNKINELQALEENSQIICIYKKKDQDLDIDINLSFGSLIPHLENSKEKGLQYNFTKIRISPELKFEDIDTLLVTHKKLEYKMNSILHINVSGHGCLHEIKSVRNFLLKLDKESYYKTGEKPFCINEFICDEENWGRVAENPSPHSKKMNKISKFHLHQYAKISLDKMNRIQYYLEVEIRNYKSDFRLVTGLLKAVSCLENIFLVKFNINIMESQFNEFVAFMETHKPLWIKNKYLTDLRINDHCDPMIHNARSSFRTMINSRKIAFLQSFVIENHRKHKILKFRKEICQDILNYLI